MADRLAGADFAELFRTFEHTAFRLETRPFYTAPVEAEPFAQFLAGEAVDLDWFQPWLDTVRSLTEQGKRMERVRILDDPLTDYQRFEMSMSRHNTAAGETVRYLHRSAAAAVGLPVDGDWWLFDSLRLARMDFDPDGHFLGTVIVNDPDIVLRHNGLRDLAIHSAVMEQRAA